LVAQESYMILGRTAMPVYNATRNRVNVRYIVPGLNIFK
jgi:hypothetical protein